MLNAACMIRNRKREYEKAQVRRKKLRVYDTVPFPSYKSRFQNVYIDRQEVKGILLDIDMWYNRGIQGISGCGEEIRLVIVFRGLGSGRYYDYHY